MRGLLSFSGILLPLCIAVLFAPAAIAGNSKGGAEWEIGVGLTTMHIPFYPGSSQSKTYFFPIPHILYRSEKLEIDNGIDATLFKTTRLRFNISADFAVPVNSQDSDKRAGMPDLDLVLQIGPSL
ncbi:MAG: MipA/OmpV family protein, partial [Gammaproteobacteria bacterium]|nr:MipA/OmpV family protein [Gammaproteobacteria bacterium]